MKKNIKIEREFVEKSALTFVILTYWLFAPQVGYDNGDTDNIPAHVYYMLSHANIWHLFGNVFVLWLIHGRLYLLPSMMIAFVFSFIPAFSIYGDVGMTMGFSGVLFAVLGIKWGVYCRCESKPLDRYEAMWRFLTRVLPFALLGILIPHLNWCLHLYCLLAGFVYGRYRR